MTLLHLDALPANTAKGTIVRLLTQVGGIDRQKIGAIEIVGRGATIEVPEPWLARLVRALDGSPLVGGHIRAWSTSGENKLGTLDESYFLERLSKLVQMEGEAEAQQTLSALYKRTSEAEAERTGTSLVGLVIREEYAGLGGRILLTFSRRDPLQPLAWTRLGIGSPVLVSEVGVRHPEQGLRGVVSNRDRTTIQVAVTQLPDGEAERPIFRVDLASDEIGRQRQQAALQRARSASGDRLAQLRKVLLGQEAPAFDEPDDLKCAHSLNLSQISAIGHGLAASDVAILHGPPGTGKTTTVVELISQAVKRGEKVLACAPSNLAVDNLFERLLARGEKALRLGHPARVLPELREHTLDLMVDRHPDVRIARKLAKQAYALRDRAGHHTRTRPAPGAKREMRSEAQAMLADARRMEAQVMHQLLDESTVLCATLTSLDSELLGQRQFHLAVIDEACQSTEPACWIPLLRSHKLVLAGDHCQLPPTVVSAEALQQGLGVSLQERLLEVHGPTIAKQLTVQYRMHQTIMEFSSQEFYHGTLIADASVREHLLCDLPGVESTPLTETPLQFIDTAGAGFDETQEPDGESRLNPQEATIVVRLARRLLATGLEPTQLAVIAPYSAQARHLRQQLDVPGLEIDTVDGFQGREKEAILLSLVRSNPTGEIGFLSDVRRMNVALTRARRKLIVIGDSATIGTHPFYVRLLEYVEQQNAYQTIWEDDFSD